MGGKSRKSGGVSKRLIERLLREKAEREGGESKGCKSGSKREPSKGLFEVPGSSESGA